MSGLEVIVSGVLETNSTLPAMGLLITQKVGSHSIVRIDPMHKNVIEQRKLSTELEARWKTGSQLVTERRH